MPKASHYFMDPDNAAGRLAGHCRDSAYLVADRGVALRLLGIASRLDDLAADIASIGQFGPRLPIDDLH